ncbi:MAG: efflux RND transporter periplasmic adaptor subunit [Chitinophagaceae bacterium]|jgi:RND family efflux transporter MFP subunit|nr:efflux RND transporter periplasmic adaptor subunit [Chitinophagaceae bacterium]MCF8422249.1 efflux RND transporter periplasmic adaptor subunit [Chitinophagaceae bacterium]
MKSFTTYLSIGLLVLAAACGGGDNTIEAKQKSLAGLKKQALELNAQIVALEKEVEKAGGASAAKAILVAIDTIQTETFTHYIELQGKVESESVSYITPRAGGGQVRAIYVKRGDRVKRGQLILQLDNTLIKQSAAAATQNIETLKSQAALAKSVYEKQKSLWEQNIGSEIQLMTAKTNADALASQLRAANEQLGMVKDQLAFTSIYSDVEGVAEEVNVKVGELFMGPGQIKIVNTAKLKLTAQVPENYAGKVKVGTELTLTFPDIQKTINNKVNVLGNVIDPLNRSFYIESKLPVDNNFRPNLLAQVKIKDYEKKNAISIPVNLLQNDEKGKFVYVAVVEAGKMFARKKMVATGEFYGNNIEVLSGLAAGDIMISEGYQSIYDGQLITTSIK